MSDPEGQFGEVGETGEPGPENPTMSRPATPEAAPDQGSNSQASSSQASNSKTKTGTLGQFFAMPSGPAILDPNFSRFFGRYVFQSALATVAILAVLLFVDNLSQAALAAGLGSSVVILFVHPSSHSASPRSLVGGHTMALVMGSIFAILLFAGLVDAFLTDMAALRNFTVAVSGGLLILGMAITDTEHPPAAGTVLGMATRPWELETFGIIIGAVVLLAVIQRILRPHLHDLM